MCSSDLELFAITPPRVDREALVGKLAHNCCTDVITGTNHCHRLGRGAHLRSSAMTAAVIRDRQISLPASSSIRIDQTCVVRPSDSGRAVA